jgi:hypothetical protein
MTLTTVNPALLDTQAQYTGLKSRIINGACVIDQRNAGAAVTPATNTYLVDRWQALASDASKLTYQQVADAPAGFKFSIKVTVASSATPASYNILWQPIEGLNVIDLGFGAAGAQTISVSFWIKGSVAGNYSAFLGNNAGRSYLASVPVTTSWVYQTVSITGDTSGTWPTTNAAGMYLGFDMGSDASRYSTAGSWLSSNVYGVTGNVKLISQANGSTLNITGVQLEKGSTATSFDYRPYGTELALCQRYFISYGGVTGYERLAVGVCNTTTTASCQTFLPVPMRTTPTLASVATWGVYDGTNVQAVTSIVADQPSNLIYNASFTVASGLTANRVAVVLANNTTTARFQLSAEL